MAANITTKLFLVIEIEIAAIYFHNSIRCSLILEMVTGKNVYLIDAGDGLIIKSCT